ncbi:MAG: beta strand repeat-containing protein [Candidatus Kerfeldbacteria bacterium]
MNFIYLNQTMKFSLLLKYIIVLIVVISASLFTYVDFALAHESGSPNVIQIHYSLRDDDGSETAASFLNTDLSSVDADSSNGVTVGTNFRIRFELSNEGTAASTTTSFILQYAALGGAGVCTSVADGNFANVPVTPTTEPVEMTTTSYYADNDQSTNCTSVTSCTLADENSLFQTGDMAEDPSNTSDPKKALLTTYYTEMEYTVAFTSNASDSETYCFRASPSDTYTVIPGVIASVPATSTISGIAYTNEGVATLNNSGGAIKIVNSSTGATASDADGTDGSGNWTVNITEPSNGDELVIWLDGATADGTLVVTYGAACTGSPNCTGLSIYQDRVIVRDENSTTVTNADLADCDNDSGTNCIDTEIGFTSNAGTLTVSDARIFYVWTGDEFVPGGTTVFDDIKIVGTYTAGSSESITVSGDWVNTGTYTASSSTITFDAADTDNIIEAGSSGFNNLTFIGSDGSGTWTAQTNDFTVSGTVDVDTSDIFTIDTGRIITHTGATMTLDGDITGAGRLCFTDASGGPGAGAGTLSAITRFDTSAGNIASTTFDARTYSGLVEIYSNSATGRTVTFASGTYTLAGASSHLYVIAAGDTPGDVTLTGVTNNPTVTIGGDLDFTGAGTSAENIISGTGTWTVSGNVNFSDGSYTATAGNTLVMDGGGLLTTAGNTLQNLTLSGGTITLANATHTVAGDLNMTGSIIIAGTSAVTMTGTSNSIVGGNETLNNLTIDPSSTGTITLQTSGLTVGGTLIVVTDDTFTIDTVTLTMDTSSSITLNGTIDGTGLLDYQSSNIFPTSGTISAPLRFFISESGDTNIPQRTYGDNVEIYNNSGANTYTATLGTVGSQTLTFSGNLEVTDDTLGGTTILTGVGHDPIINITGDLITNYGGGGTPTLNTGISAWTVTGNIDFTGGSVTFTSGNTFQMDGSSKTITSDGNTFQGLSVTGTGDVSNADQLAVAADFSIGASANFSHGNNVDFIATGDGETSFVITDGGTFDSSGAGTGKLILDGVLDDQWFDDQSTGAKQDMGIVQIGQSPGTTKLKSDFSASSLTIATGDRLETHGWEVDISGAIDVQGTGAFDLQDDAPNADADPTTVTFGGNWTMSGTGTFIPFTNSIVEPDGTADQTVTTGSKAFYNFYSNNAGASDDVDDVIISGAFTVDGALTVNDGELDLTINDPVTDVAGNVSITSGAELNASDSSAFNVAGSWDNNGTFTSNSGTVTFDSDAGSETVEAGSQSFGTVVFNHASGDWTVQTDNMTTSSNLTLTAASAFSVASVVLEVGGNFDLSVAGANTTWTGSTLYLNGSGGMYNINNKTHLGDTFITLRIGASEDIVMWDSVATTFTIDSGGCLFSQDHAGSAGRLNIYGTCNSRTNEYWSYAKDFEDGAAVTRQADVRFAPGASMTVDNGETLEIKGQNAASNRTLITRDSTGNYAMDINGTINAQYYDFDYIDNDGLYIHTTATVTELSDGSFDNAGDGVDSRYIVADGITSDDIFRNVIFDDNGDGIDSIVDFNVDAIGAGVYWKFLWWDGNKGGEAYDQENSGAVVDWSDNLGFSLSANVMNLGVINTLTVGSDNHNLTVTTNAPNGYTCSVVEDGNIRNGADDIDDVVDNTVTAGSEEYGISCTGADCQLGANDVAITGAPLTVASNAGRVTASATAMTYEAAAAAITAGAIFSHIVTYTCAGDF